MPNLFWKITAVLLALIGLVLSAGGVWLGSLGGSLAYVAIGAGCLVSGWLLWRGRRSAIAVYGALLAAIYGWSFWEVGFDGWALAPRVIAPTVVGLWLLVLLVSSGKDDESSPRERRLTAGFALICALVLVAGILARPAGWERHYIAPAGPLPAIAFQATQAQTDEWKAYGGDPGGARFSGLTDLTPATVQGLKLAWTTRLGPENATLEVTPLKVGGLLYVCNGADVVSALDPETGATRWRYDPNPPGKKVTPRPCRGVAYFDAGTTGGDCPQRILATTLDARLVALDAATGRLCQTFGQAGSVNLKTGLGPTMPGYYGVTSAPTVVGGKVILGASITDNQFVGEPSGVVRAFDARNGALVWAWDVGRLPGQAAPEGAAFTPGTPNVWAPISADEGLGLIYLPTGNSTPDYWSAHRTPASQRVSSSVVAIDAATGATHWIFQTVHRDVWDYDVSPQPTLLDVKGPDGAVIPALLQTSKRGQLFLLDRRTGVSLTKVVERLVPQHGGPGEHLSPTQPYSVELPSVDAPDLTEKDMWGLTLLDQLWCRVAYRRARYEGQFTPPGADSRPSIEYPGTLGGANWGGISIDPERQLAVFNISRMANYVRTIPRAEADARGIKPVGLGPRIGFISPQVGTPFAINPAPFLSPLEVPCQRPPFGMITVVDLARHRVIWSHPLGTSRDVGPFNWRLPLDIPMGSVNLGGTLTTRGGLVFVAATQEQSLRAFDLRNGKLVWRSRLPAGGQATPMTYRSEASGRQFVVIAAGGSKALKARGGGYLVAYALPGR